MSKKPYLLKLPFISEKRGSLTYLSDKDNIPFKPGRIVIHNNFQIGFSHEFHVSFSEERFFIALSGSVAFDFTNPDINLIFKLDSPDTGLWIPSGSSFTITECTNELSLLELSNTGVDNLKPDLSKTSFSDMKIQDCKIEAPDIIRYGNFNTLIVNDVAVSHIFFKRIFYIYHVPEGAQRGGHAHKDISQLIIAVKGSFDVKLYDGTETKKIKLSEYNKTVLIPPGIWADLDNFTKNTLCLVLASGYYDKNEYIYKLTEFNELKHVIS